MVRLTATEARKLAGRSLNDKIDSMLESIKLVAESGRKALNTNVHHCKDMNLWVDGAIADTIYWKHAKKTLENLGYKVTLNHDNSSVNSPYTLIQW